MNQDRAIWVHGVSGRMGTLIKQAVEATPGVFFAGGSGRSFVDRHGQKGEPVTVHALAQALCGSDLAIDFSTREGSMQLCAAIAHCRAETRPAVLVGTTGLTKDDLAKWRAVEHCALLLAPNTSLGIMVLSQLTRQLSQYLPQKNFDIEIVETHHRYKTDAPSGTAKFLATTAQAANTKLSSTHHRTDKRREGEIGVHAVRGGNVFGEHEVRFLGDQEEIYLGHRAFSRDLFAYGAVTLGQWLMQQKAGTYGLCDVEL